MSILNWPQSPTGELTIFGAEPPMPDHLMEFQLTLRDFAVNVMRPTGIQLDRMSPEQVISENSPLWEFRKKYLELGLNLETLRGLSTEDFSLTFSLIFEELGYGDAGLAISMGAALLPQYLVAKFENHFLLERFPETMCGSCGITEPYHESYFLDTVRHFQEPDIDFGRPNCTVKKYRKKIIINGQKSAWVSNGSIADVCIINCLADFGEGKSDSKKGYVVLVPMDSPGVTSGKLLDNFGQRALNQSELFFDNVELSMDYVLAGPDTYQRALYCIHVVVNALKGAIFTGVAQSAYEMALDYAHDIKQGGVAIISHQSVALRLFHMYRKVEMARALNHRVCLYNDSADVPALNAAMAAKISTTQISYEVANDALQIIGCNGLTKKYPIGKILRDSRTSLI